MIYDRPDFTGHAATIREAARNECSRCGRAVTGPDHPPFPGCEDTCPVLELLRIADDIEQSSRASKRLDGPDANRPCIRRRGAH